MGMGHGGVGGVGVGGTSLPCRLGEGWGIIYPTKLKVHSSHELGYSYYGEVRLGHLIQLKNFIGITTTYCTVYTDSVRT